MIFYEYFCRDKLVKRIFVNQQGTLVCIDLASCNGEHFLIDIQSIHRH